MNLTRPVAGLIVEVTAILRIFPAVKLIPDLARASLLSTVYVLRGDQPAFDGVQRQQTSQKHDWERREKMHPPHRIKFHLDPHDEEREREGNDAQGKEGRTIVWRCKPIVETAGLASVRDLQPRLKHVPLAASRAKAFPTGFHNPAEFVTVRILSHMRTVCL